MLSICDCRGLLGARCTLSDADLQTVRDQLYALATVAVGAHLEHCRHLKEKRRSTACVPESTGGSTAAKPFDAALDLLPEPEREHVEERAAVLEYDAGFDRDTAERKAVADWLKRRE